MKGWWCNRSPAPSCFRGGSGAAGRSFHATEDSHLEKTVFPRPDLSPLSPPAVLLKFRTDKGRDPDPQSSEEDGELLRQIRSDVLDALGLSANLLNDDFIR